MSFLNKAGLLPLELGLVINNTIDGFLFPVYFIFDHHVFFFVIHKRDLAL